jgi:ribosomal protein S18 acetylase RimI-like enzyme
MIVVQVLSSNENLERIVGEINTALWDEQNEMSEYEVESLQAYLKREDTLFLTCHSVESDRSILLGIASARVEMKPYGKELWLYVDEVDVCSDQRQRGAGKSMMLRLIEIAKERGCEEMWLGAERENRPANALYQSLSPDEVADVIGYTYETGG